MIFTAVYLIKMIYVLAERSNIPLGSSIQTLVISTNSI